MHRRDRCGYELDVRPKEFRLTMKSFAALGSLPEYLSISETVVEVTLQLGRVSWWLGQRESTSRLVAHLNSNHFLRSGNSIMGA